MKNWKNYSVKFSRSLITLPLLFMGLSGCNQSTQTLPEKNSDARVAEDLYIVDCLLPGQIRKLGNTTFLTSKRPIKTTAADCNIRGGEYTSYDRADYRTALNVWLEKAQEGDPEAQNYVGEIFEKGLGQEVDYGSAVHWYSKAAEQGYSRAQINLGFMYEQGLGVEKNLVTALNLYRQGAGTENDALVLNSEAQKELNGVRQQMASRLATAETQANVLNRQIENLQASLIDMQEQNLAQNSDQPQAQPGTSLSHAEQEIMVLRDLYAQTQQEKVSLEQELAQLDANYRKIEDTQLLEPVILGKTDARVIKNTNFGRYFALIIGNQDYQHFEDLRSPVRDAIRLKELLETKYGFSVITLPNANEQSMLATLNDLYKQLTPEDNLLIYYAGHGNMRKSSISNRVRGYWLPVDAQLDNINTWLSNSIISDHLDRLRARSVLIVADSCYAGSLGSRSSAFLFGTTMGEMSEQSIKSGLGRRSRLVISSGGDKPVLDGTSSSHSIFANSLIEVLESNSQAIRDSMLFSQLSVNVRKRNESMGGGAEPEMKPIRTAGHEGGAFFFVPVNSLAQR